MNPLRIGTRGSPLALWQANHVAHLLRSVNGQRPVVLVEIETSGDRVRDRSLASIGGEGVFTREIQNALLREEVDVAVHSLKDLPTVPVEGLTLGAVPPRGPVGDVLVSPKTDCFDQLPRGSTLATSSPRRRSQVLHRRPDLKLVDIRGNVETRLRKLKEQGLDGIILAEAGLVRLGLKDKITEVLDRAWMLPAVGQGALGLECRSGDRETLLLLEKLDDPDTRQSVRAERALLRGLGGGCQMPVGALSEVRGEALWLRGAVLLPDGSRRIEAVTEGPLKDAEALGSALAQLLLGKGARQLLGGGPG